MKKYEGYALITGGTSGIGLALANQLAEKGYDLVLVARNQADLKMVAADIKNKHNVDVVTISQDLGLEESTDIIYDELQKRKIHVGLLINNAGFGGLSYFHEMPRDKILNMINVMCLSLTDLTHRFLPAMIEKKSGGVILISSIGALVPSPLFAVYSSTKAFQLKLGVSLHAEYSNFGVDFLTVCPGAVKTNFQKAAGFEPSKSGQLSADEVATKTLGALGKRIALVLPSDFGQRVGLFLNKFLTDRASIKLVKKFYKRMWDKDL